MKENTFPKIFGRMGFVYENSQIRENQIDFNFLSGQKFSMELQKEMISLVKRKKKDRVGEEKTRRRQA